MWVCCAWGLGSRPGGARSSTGKVHTNGPGPRRTRGCLMGTGGQRGGQVVAARAELSLAPLWDPPRVRTGPPAGGSVCETQRPNLKESPASPEPSPSCVHHTQGGPQKLSSEKKRPRHEEARARGRNHPPVHAPLSPQRRPRSIFKDKTTGWLPRAH